MSECALGTICRYRTESAPTDQLPYLSTESMRPNKKGIIPNEAAPSVGKARLFHKGDTLISNIRPYFKKIWQAEYDGCCSADVLVFEPHSCDSDYLYWLLCDDAFFAYMVTSSKGTKMPRGDKDAIMRYKVRRQSATEQRRLAAALNPIRELIRINQRTNDYLFQCCAAKMNDIVGVPSSTIKVDDCCELIYSGGTPSTKNPAYWNGDLPWLSSGETRSRFIIDTEKTITELGVMESSTKLAKTGDIVMASAGQGFTRGQTSMLFFDTYVNQSVVVMRPKKDYGAYLLLMLAGQYDNLRAWSDSTSTRGSMSGKLLKQFELPYFDANQAKELTEFAAPMFRMIENNMRESKVLAQARDVLLPKLMSGEIDLAKIEFPTQPNNHLGDC